jgi:hypothetical protein
MLLLVVEHLPEGEEWQYELFLRILHRSAAWLVGIFAGAALLLGVVGFTECLLIRWAKELLKSVFEWCWERNAAPYIGWSCRGGCPGHGRLTESGDTASHDVVGRALLVPCDTARCRRGARSFSSTGQLPSGGRVHRSTRWKH